MMQPPPNFYSYDELLRRMTQHAQQQQVDEQLVELLRRFFEKELDQASPVLSRPERKRLLREFAQAMLSAAQKKIDGTE